MNTITKTVLLFMMYGLPVCLAFIYSINKNIKIKRSMITENEVPDILGVEFPEINYELEKLSNSSNIYKTMQCFADFTKLIIKKGNLKAVKHCFNTAEKMMNNGNSTVKNAVENVYVYSIGTVVALSALTTNQLKNIFTGSLRKKYNKQIRANGI